MWFGILITLAVAGLIAYYCLDLYRIYSAPNFDFSGHSLFKKKNTSTCVGKPGIPP
jgi:hypothetical protein